MNNKTGDTAQIRFKAQEHRFRKNQVYGEKDLVFTVIKGNELDFGKTYYLTKKTIINGRDKHIDLLIEDQGVRQQHCRVDIKKYDEMELVIITDIGSTNGTYVNGELIRQAEINPGDRIEIGETILRFGFSDEIEEDYHARLFSIATTDSLTGFFNKRFIMTELENHSRIAKRNNRVFSIFLLDIDNFKEINDTMGHIAGDEYLKKISDIIRSSLREQDLAGRFGGDEFLIILPETDILGARQVANRIRGAIAKITLLVSIRHLTASISAGIGQFSIHGDTPESLLKKTDDALMNAKRQGKNLVMEAEE